MPRFFVAPEKVSDGMITIDTDDVQHIKRVLRLGTGDIITVCDTTGMDYSAEICELREKAVLCNVISEKKNCSEPNISVTIYQALPKASKMEYIIQKNTELGVVKIVPCELSRCVVRLLGKDAEKKCARWQKIADEAAKQCGRGILPEVGSVHSFADALNEMKKADLCFVPYECETNNCLRELLVSSRSAKSISFMIGPEGGFAPEEIERLKAAKIPSVIQPFYL